MPRYTAAYFSLSQRLKEVSSLLSLARDLTSQDFQKNSNKINALSRSAVVLLSSHIEGYIKDLGELTLERLHSRAVDRSHLSDSMFYYVSSDLIEKIRDTSEKEKVARRIFEFIDRDGDIWQQSGPLPRSLPPEVFLRSFANPSYKKIKSFLGRFGYTSLEADLGTRLRANFRVYVNTINHIVDTRNQIAHGDMALQKTPMEVEQMSNQAKTFCMCLDSGFANWCRQRLCVIR